MTTESICGIDYDDERGYMIGDGNPSLSGFDECDALRYIALHVQHGEDARLMWSDERNGANREAVIEAIRPLARTSGYYQSLITRDDCPHPYPARREHERDGVYWYLCEDCGQVLEHYDP
jgi:hypothetical protein